MADTPKRPAVYTAFNETVAGGLTVRRIGAKHYAQNAEGVILGEATLDAKTGHVVAIDESKHPRTEPDANDAIGAE